MNTIQKVTKKDITSQTATFINAMQQAKQLESDLKAFWDAIYDEMQKHSIQSVKGEWGALTLATRKVWSAETHLPPRFYKQTLDTSRLNSILKLGDALPRGAVFTTTEYLSKRIK